MRSHVQPRNLVHVSGVHCHVRASSTSGCAFVYFTVQYCIEYGSTVSLFQAQDVQKQANNQWWCIDSWYYCIFQGTVPWLKCLFFVFVFMYYLCEKYYKPITVQYYIADCVSWVPRLTLLDLLTNWTYARTLGMELIVCRGLTVYKLYVDNIKQLLLMHLANYFLMLAYYTLQCLLWSY